MFSGLSATLFLSGFFYPSVGIADISPHQGATRSGQIERSIYKNARSRFDVQFNLFSAPLDEGSCHEVTEG